MTIIRNLNDWQRRPSDYRVVANNISVLMADPHFFSVAEAQNNHMHDEHGNLHKIDIAQAKAEWQQLRDSFINNGLSVDVLDAHPELPDLCFTANPSFIVPHYQHMWCGNMSHESRRPETEMHLRFFKSRGYQSMVLKNKNLKFEGHGDGVWHPQRFLLHAAVGQRSDLAAWQEIDAAYPELDILLYELQNPDFYHLDTALACLDQTTALVIKQAFTDEAYQLICAAFPDAIELSSEEAYKFAGNAFCPDGINVFLEQGCDQLNASLRLRGFKPQPVATEQFRLSGGSVFCLKQSF